MDAEIEKLTALNQRYLDSYRNGLTDFFEEVLHEDFKEVAPDGTVLDKAHFLEKIASRFDPEQTLTISAAELDIQFFAETALVRAIPDITNPDGSSFKGGRYTDVYVLIDGEWSCVAAHLGGTPN